MKETYQTPSSKKLASQSYTSSSANFIFDQFDASSVNLMEISSDNVETLAKFFLEKRALPAVYDPESNTLTTVKYNAEKE